VFIDNCTKYQKNTYIVTLQSCKVARERTSGLTVKGNNVVQNLKVYPIKPLEFVSGLLQWNGLDHN